jgi:hypothetical protein
METRRELIKRKTEMASQDRIGNPGIIVKFERINRYL